MQADSTSPSPTKSAVPVPDTGENESGLLEIRGLDVVFPTEMGEVYAVRNSSFTLKPGRTLAIVGESGSGKSVSCYAILRILQDPGYIASGSILFKSQRRQAQEAGKEGQPAHSSPPFLPASVDLAKLDAKDPLLFKIRGGSISLIFQEPQTALSPVHTIGNQLIEAIRLHQDVTKKEARQKAIEMLRTVGMPQPENRIDQYPHEISGGMRQRVVIAMALVCRPEILIADEPTTALDVTVQAQILELINELKEKLNTSVIFITHDLGVVAQIADDVVVMNKGRIVEKGTVYEIFEEPLHPYTQALIRAMPRLDEKKQALATVAAQEAQNAATEWLPEGYRLAPSDPGWWSVEAKPPIEPILHVLSPSRSILLWEDHKK